MMAEAPSETTRAGPSPFWTGKLFRVLVVLLVVALSAAIFAFRERFAELAAIGYPGIFLVSLMSNATIVLPAPSLALVFAMGSALPWLPVGLAAGAGEALGELTGYLAGVSGRAVIENKRAYKRMEAWMRKAGGITILLLSIIPNPLFDLAGIAAGTLGYPLRRFLAICWVGKTIKTAIVAWAGAQSITMIEPFLH
jgi:membrane protein YqaA with SNARE-associated domain